MNLEPRWNSAGGSKTPKKLVSNQRWPRPYCSATMYCCMRAQRKRRLIQLLHYSLRYWCDIPPSFHLRPFLIPRLSSCYDWNVDASRWGHNMWAHSNAPVTPIVIGSWHSQTPPTIRYRSLKSLGSIRSHVIGFRVLRSVLISNATDLRSCIPRRQQGSNLQRSPAAPTPSPSAHSTVGRDGGQLVLLLLWWHGTNLHSPSRQCGRIACMGLSIVHVPL